jgi:hypothetical protein
MRCNRLVQCLAGDRADYVVKRSEVGQLGQPAGGGEWTYHQHGSALAMPDQRAKRSQVESTVELFEVDDQQINVFLSKNMRGLLGAIRNEQAAELIAAHSLEIDPALGVRIEEQSKLLGAGIGLLRHTFSL